MFIGLTFTVVPYSIDLGVKRKKILENIITKNKGKIINLEKINSKLIPDFILTSMHNAFLKRVNDTTSQLITSQLISVEDSIFYTLKNIQDKFETGRSVLSDGQYYAPYEYKSFYVQAIENIDKYFANRRYSGLSISN